MRARFSFTYRNIHQMALHRDRGCNSVQRAEQQTNPIQFKLLRYLHLSEIRNVVLFIIVVIKFAAPFLERFMSSSIQYQPQVSLKKHQGEYKQYPAADGLKTKKLHELAKLRHLTCNFLAPETRRCSVFSPWSHLQTLLPVQVEARDGVSRPSPADDWQRSKTPLREKTAEWQGRDEVIWQLCL